MKLSTHARVLSSNGEDIGHLSRFVMDPQTKMVTHIVLEHNLNLFEKAEFIIPMDLIDHANEQGVHLHPLPVNKVDDLPRFLIDQYRITNERALLNRGLVSDEMNQGVYYYPTSPGGAEGMIRPDDMYVNSPANQGPSLSSFPGQGPNTAPVMKEDEKNTPEGTVAIKEGAKVVSSDSKHLGNIEKVYVDPNSNKATHMLITKGLLTKEKKLVPATLIKNAGDEEVLLDIAEASYKDLPDYEGQ